MSDIELPAVDDFLPAEKRWTTANFLACTEAYARAAVLADREKRAQACDHQYHYFGDQQKRRRCNRCNELEPVQAEAPTASDAEREAHPRQLCMMAAAILDQPTGTMDNRHPYWPQAVEQAKRAFAALATQQEAQPQATGPLSFNCTNGCGACGVKLRDFVTHATQAQDGDDWVTIASEPEIVSTCCGSPVEVWDERKQDIVGQVRAAQAEPAGGDKEDAERLDWLESIGTANLQRMRRMDPKAPKYWDVEYGPDETCAKGATLRDAIDAARAAQQATGERG